MATTQVHLVINGEEKLCKVKMLTLGEQGDITDQAMLDGIKKGLIDPDIGLPVPSNKTMNILTIKTGLVEPKLNEEQIAQLPNHEAVVILQAIRRIRRPLGTSPSSSSDTKE